MDRTSLDEKIRRRASELTQAAIRQFQRDVAAALNTLCGSCGLERRAGQHIPYGGGIKDDELTGKLFSCLSLSLSQAGQWPKELWDGGRDRLLTEVLETMDVVQRTLQSKGPDPDGPQPPTPAGPQPATPKEF